MLRLSSMMCKKDHPEKNKCMCLKRRLDGCIGCEKKAIKVVQESGRNLNEIITDVKRTGETKHDLYVGVNLLLHTNRVWFPQSFLRP